LLVGVEVNTLGGVTSRPVATPRRKSAGERRTEILDAAAAIAVSEGMERVTAKRVAEQLGVFPGLVSHYFATADELVAAAFGQAASEERDGVFSYAFAVPKPLDQMRRLIAAWLHTDRDQLSLLWLDAWQASRRRPALSDEVARQMAIDLERLRALVADGVSCGDFQRVDPTYAAMQILTLVDGLSVQAATRATFDYTMVRTMVPETVERVLGLPARALAAKTRRIARNDKSPTS
jgi:AcrR family transcriptional regulator